ncbi:MAG: JAB domain-containing protein [Deltaproteobacteria bacterium]|nr:JAB domain-containing protein [Deltaproteobacteria bacterium]
MPVFKPKKLYVKLKAATSELPPLPPINTPSAVIGAAQKVIGDNAYETFLVLYLNNQNNVFAYEEFTDGGLSSVTVHPSTVIRNAVIIGARAIITVHQHPSGINTPSDDDLRLWKKLKEQADFMDLALLDNFIITDSGYYSEMENGR